MNPPPRVATLVLVTPDGDVVGELPPVPVATPWWQDIEPVVDAVRDRLGVETTVLRLLESELDIPHGGGVTYLAEIDEPVPAQPWHGMLDEQPLRQRWARVGGPAADLAWADAALTELGLRRSGPARQIRSWNLSSLWRIPVADGWTWLKVVPPFFGHEGSMLARLAGGPVPTLLARDGERILMAEIAGEDLYDADVPVLARHGVDPRGPPARQHR